MSLFDGSAYDDAPDFDEMVPPADWKRHACPDCRAAVGQSCRRPSGHRAHMPHRARVEAVERERLAARFVVPSAPSGNLPADAAASVEPEDHPPT